MASTVENAANATVDLQTKAVELIDQLTAGLKAVAPQMADVTLAAIRFQGVMDLISTIGFLIGSAGIAYAAVRAGRWAHNLGSSSFEVEQSPERGAGRITLEG